MSSYRVGMVSLGCPKNQMDAELMLARLRDAGSQLASVRRALSGMPRTDPC